MIKTKQVLIALAVIGANVLHNMPIYTSLAAEADYTITQNNGTKIYNSEFDDEHEYPAPGDIKGNTSDGGLSDTSFEGNRIILRKGTYDKAVQGALCQTPGIDVTNNELVFYGGKFKKNINGGNATGSGGSSGSSVGNKVTFYEGVTFSGNNVYCGFSVSGNATENIVTIEGGTFTNDSLKIYGGFSNKGNAIENNLRQYRTKNRFETTYLRVFMV